MRKTLIFTLCLAVASLSMQAQDAKTLVKNIVSALSSYSSNPVSNAGDLTTAKSTIETALMDPLVGGDFKSLMSIHDAVNKALDAETKAKLLSPGFVSSDPSLCLVAVDLANKALNIDPNNKGNIKKAAGKLADLESSLANAGIDAYNAKDYATASKIFSKELELKNILVANGKKSRLEDPAQMNDKLFFTGVAAYYNKDWALLNNTFGTMVKNGTDKPEVYQLLIEGYNATGETDKSKETLDAGRIKFPDESSLLFSEINYYLQKGETQTLIDKLKIAQEKEPGNLSVILTLGNVYDKLSVTEADKGNAEKSLEYFKLAEKAYNDVLAKDQDNFDANYSIGALNYNKAATFTKIMNDLGNDFTPAGTKKYDAAKADMIGYFSAALPSFLKCESLKADDRNTLIALKEIYARQDNFEKSNEYKSKLGE